MVLKPRPRRIRAQLRRQQAATACFLKLAQYPRAHSMTMPNKRRVSSTAMPAGYTKNTTERRPRWVGWLKKTSLYYSPALRLHNCNA